MQHIVLAHSVSVKKHVSLTLFSDMLSVATPKETIAVEKLRKKLLKCNT